MWIKLTLACHLQNCISKNWWLPSDQVSLVAAVFSAQFDCRPPEAIFYGRPGLLFLVFWAGLLTMILRELGLRSCFLIIQCAVCTLCFALSSWVKTHLSCCHLFTVYTIFYIYCHKVLLLKRRFRSRTACSYILLLLSIVYTIIHSVYCWCLGWPTRGWEANRRP